MAFRLAYQISCNLTKPGVFRNSSTENARRFRSCSPPIRSFQQLPSIPEVKPKKKTHLRRSHSLSAPFLPVVNPLYISTRNESGHHTTDNRQVIDEYYDREEDYSFSELAESQRIQEARRMDPMLNPDLQKGINPSTSRKINYAAKRQYAKAVDHINRVAAEKKVPKYHLESADVEVKPKGKNVYLYFSELHRRRDTKIMPHLQPGNLKPYGNMDSLMFPVFGPRKRKEVKYPIAKTHEGTAGGAKGKRDSTDNSSRKRNISTSGQTRSFSSLSKEQRGGSEEIISEFKRLNPHYKSTRFMSEEGSDEVEKCNQIIYDYKRLNPTYAYSKRDYSSGSPEERQAVETATKFASDYKNRIYKEKYKKVVDEPMLSFKNKPAEDKSVEGREVPDGRPIRKKYSFRDMNLPLPEIPITPISIRIGPKINLLQSSASPDTPELSDRIILNKNERLIVPWPSYSDRVKGKDSPKGKRFSISYPALGKDVKNATNQEARNKEAQKRFPLQNTMSEINIDNLIKKNEENMKASRPFGSATNVRVEKENEIWADKLWLKKNVESIIAPVLFTKENSCSYTKRCFSLFKKKMVGPEVTARRLSESTEDAEEEAAEKKLPRNVNKAELDCPCVPAFVPDKAPTMKRLEKVNIPEPPKVCPVTTCADMARADDGLKVKSRKLPKIKSEGCPCVDPYIPDQAPCLVRPPKKDVQEPPKICPVPKCPPRADDGLQIKMKTLPKIVPGDCPCIELEMKDSPPLERLKKKPVEEPLKVCKPPIPCPPRADECLKVAKKALPRFKPRECPCVHQVLFEDVPPLERLKKVEIPEPPKVCPVPVCDPRSDEINKYSTKKKPLQALKPGNCPCVDPHIPDKDRPLHRLKKANIAEPPKICPVTTCSDMARADDGLKVKSKKLPKIKSEGCPCVDPYIPDQAPCLVRPPKKDVQEPAKICPVPKCPPRADDGLQIKMKTLPKICPGECPCIELVMKDSPPLERLKKKPVDEPPKVCKPPIPCPPRADECLKVAKKPLPRFKPRECPCVAQVLFEDVPPLERLKKVEIPEPPKVCPVPVCDPRSDEINKYANTKKPLQPMILNEKHNTTSSREFNKKKKSGNDPSRTERRKFTTYTRLDVPFWRFSKGYAPKSRAASMRMYSISAEGTFMPKLRRLQKRAEYEDDVSHDIDWEARDECDRNACKVGAPRMDEIVNYQPSRKKLPRIFSKCEFVAPEPSLCDEPGTFERPVPRIKYPEPEKPCPVDPCEVAKRADDDIKVRPKTLPILKTSTCTCIDPTGVREDKTPDIKRLPKFDDNDIDWKGLDRCKERCPTYEVTRADETYKEKKRILPKLKFNDCPTFCPFTNDVKQPELKRLPKPEFEDHPPWDCPMPCDESQTSRSDVICGYEIKRKKLPSLLPQSSTREICTYSYSAENVGFAPPSTRYMNCRQFSTGPTRFAGKNNGKSDKQKKCPKLGASTTGSKCPKMSLGNCPPKFRENCDRETYKECCKQISPYPAFSECKDHEQDDVISECRFSVDPNKHLQPKWPIFEDATRLKPPPPIQGKIDPDKEVECVMKKLGMKNEGKTKTCEDFHLPDVPIRAKDLLAQAEADAEAAAQAQGSSLVEIRAKALEEARDENKAEAGQKDKCPIVDLHTHKCEKDDSCSGQEKEEADNKMTCGLKKKDDECEKERKKVEAVAPPKSLWERICDYFKARPNCPTPDEWKKKRLRSDAEAAAAAAGLCVCEKEPECKEEPEVCEEEPEETCEEEPKKPPNPNFKPCKKVGSKCDAGGDKGGKAESQPEKKSEAKPQMKAEGKPEMKAEAKPEKKAEPKPEKKAEAQPVKKAEEKPARDQKKPDEKPSKTSGGTAACKTAEQKCGNEKKEKKCGEKEPEKKEKKCGEEPAKKEKQCGEEKPEKKEKKCGEKEPEKKEKNCGEKEPEKKEQKCGQKEKQCGEDKPEKKEQKCAKPPAEKCGGESEAAPAGCGKKEKKPAKKPCKKAPPRKNPRCSAGTKPPAKKKDDKADKCGKGAASCEKKPSNTKCKNFKVDCPPRDRDTCEGYIFPPCCPTESPYPSFSECHSPFKRLPTDECTESEKRYRKQPAISNPNDNPDGGKKEAKEDKCKKSKRKGSKAKKGKGGGKKCYSTLAASMPFWQQRRNYSKGPVGRGLLDPFAFFNVTEETVRDMDQKELAEKILGAVRKGMETLESNGQIGRDDPYYKIFKELESLSQNEIERWTPDKKDVMAYACKFDEPSLLSDCSFAKKKSSIDLAGDLDEVKVMEAFQQFCRTIGDINDIDAISYEESERRKTVEVQRELDDILANMNKTA